MSEVAPKGLEGIVVADSAITRIDGLRGELEYRGFPVADLARARSFESVAYLLWHGELPDPQGLAELNGELDRHRAAADSAIQIMRALPLSAHPLEAVRVAVTNLAAADPDRSSMSSDALLRQSKRLTATMPLFVGAWDRLRKHQSPHPHVSGDSTAVALLRALSVEVSEASLRAMDADLVVYADHEFNASTFTARVVAATEADLYSAVTAALAALKGPKHGGANEDVADLFDEIGTVDRVEAVMVPRIERYRSLTSEQRRSNKERFPGFGHRVWKVDDPRAETLRGLAAQVCTEMGREDLIAIAERVRELVQRDLKLVINVDYYSAALYGALGIARDLCTSIFAVARVAGWTAHIMEQIANNRLIRPRSNYIGTPTRILGDALSSPLSGHAEHRAGAA